jgi:hypothetical protein
MRKYLKRLLKEIVSEYVQEEQTKINNLKFSLQNIVENFRDKFDPTSTNQFIEDYREAERHKITSIIHLEVVPVVVHLLRADKTFILELIKQINKYQLKD